MNNLRMNLLGEIIINNGVVSNKYSNGLNNLRAVIELEKSDDKDKLPLKLFDEFEDILLNSNNLCEITKNVPFIILEQYYFRNYRDLSKEVYIEWEENAFEMKIKELFLLLETFYNKIHLLAVKIADFYNLEFKLKNNNPKSDDYI